MLAANRSWPRSTGAAPRSAVRTFDALEMFYISIADGAEVVTAFREKRKPEFVRTASALPPVLEAWLRPDRVTRRGERLPLAVGGDGRRM